MRTVVNTKRKMQNVSFKTIDDFLEFLLEDELKIVEYLRDIIYNCIPECSEKLSYNVPYYKRHTNICFIWPGSITWGSGKHKGVKLGFTNGYLLNDEINYLEKGGRKQVYWKTFNSIKEIDANLVKAYIYNAVLIDEEKADIQKIHKHSLKRNRELK